MISEKSVMSFQELERLLEGIEKPGRYTDSEIGIKSKSLQTLESRPDIVNTALVFPDIYEVGMSNLGLQILYKEINRRQDLNAERVFSPWLDMEKRLRETSTVLFSLENRIFLDEFELIGISAQHELLYTNILNVLDLSGLDIRSSERDELFPLICIGGAAMINPVPMSSFMDFAVIGEGEDLITEVLSVVKKYKESHLAGQGARDLKKRFLKEVARLEGIYVPEEHRFIYSGAKIAKIENPGKVKKAYIKDFDKRDILTDPVVPNIRAVHDRFVAEIMRGCPRGCRFCQAGYFYRPVRRKDLKKLVGQSVEGMLKTGFDEISFMSLSTTDYRDIERLLDGFTGCLKDRHISVSLPSLRIDDFSLRLAELIGQGRRTGLTFAPEAGSQRMRDIIGKDIEEKTMLECIAKAFSRGWDRLKLYFIIGFVFEKEEDIEAIVDLVYRIRELARENLGKKSFRRFKLNISVNAFIPKPFTPFQWLPFDPGGRLKERFEILKKKLPKSFVKLSWSDVDRSMLESVLSRGDERVSLAIEHAWQDGARFDNWSDIFDFNKWSGAFLKSGLDMGLYTRAYNTDELLPWDIIDIGIKKQTLVKEYDKALAASGRKVQKDG